MCHSLFFSHPLAFFPSLLRSDSLLILAASSPVIIYAVPLLPLSSPMIHHVFAWLPSSGTPVETPEDVGVRFGGFRSCHFSLLLSLLPCFLPPFSSLSLTGDTLKWIPEIAPLLFPLSLHADGFFIIFCCSYERVKIHIFKSVYLPSLFTLICDVSLSYSTPHPYSLSLPLFILWHFSIPSLLFHHWFLHSLNVRPSIRLSPCHSHISLYCLVFLFYIFHPTGPPPHPPPSLPELQGLACLLRNKSTSHAATSQ